MHAAHISLTETLAAAPPKASLAGHLLQSPDTFGLAWQQQMSAPGIIKPTAFGAYKKQAQAGPDTATSKLDKDSDDSAAAPELDQALGARAGTNTPGSAQTTLAEVADQSRVVARKDGNVELQSGLQRATNYPQPDTSVRTAHEVTPTVSAVAIAVSQSTQQMAARDLAQAGPDGAAPVATVKEASASAPTALADAAKAPARQTAQAPIAAAIPTQDDKLRVGAPQPAAPAAATPQRLVKAKPESRAGATVSVHVAAAKPRGETSSSVPIDIALNAVVPVAAASIASAKGEGSLRVSSDEPIEIAATVSKRDRSSITAGVGRDSNAKPAQPSGEDSTPAGKQTASASTLQHVEKAALEQNSAPSSAGVSAGHLPHESGTASAQELHTTQPGAGITVTAPATAANLSPVASTAALTTGTPIPPSMPSVGGHQILSSGPAQLDVGVLDSTHGWLQIRAELGTDGAVSASVTGSALAHESLREVLPEMASYLQSEALGISSIAVHRSADAAHAAAGTPTAAQTNADAQGQAPRGGQAQDDADSARKNPTPADGLSGSAAAETQGISAGSAPEANDIAKNTDKQMQGVAVQGTAGPASVDWGSGTAVSEFAGGAGFFAGSNGGWLNVSA